MSNIGQTSNIKNSTLPIQNKTINGTDISKREVILVVGTEQHSPTYGNALMFPAQAVREVRENFSKTSAVTILIFTDGYTEMSLKIIERDAKILNPKLNFKRINSTDELINHINNGDKNRDRNIFKIGIMKIFAHGMPSRFVFGLDGANAIKQEFAISHITKLKVSSFTPKATIYSYACRTANCDERAIAVPKAYIYDDESKKLVKPQESLAQKLSNYLDARVYAYIVRSEYSISWDDNHDKTYYPTYITIENEKTNSITGTPKAIWTVIKRNWNKQRNVWDEMLWNSKGAYKVPISGDTPKGLPRKMFLFEKNKIQRFF